MSDILLTPVGRMIQGDLFVGSDKDFYGKPRTTKEGTPSLQFFAAFAIPKTDPSWGQFWGQLQAEAQAGFPKGEWQWQGKNPANGAPDPNFIFAWKVEDGDGPKYQGKEGAAGCWVVKATSGFAPSVFNEGNQQILNPAEAVRGYYYQLAVSFKANGDAQKPGMFINLNMARRVGYGEPIIGGPDANVVFGAAPAQLPPGASATPIAPHTQMPAMGGGQQMQQPAQQGGYPAQQMQQGGYPAQQMQQGGYPAQQMQQGGYPAQQMQQGGYVDPNANAGYQQPSQYVDPNAAPQQNAQGYPTAGMSPTNQPNQQQINPAGDFLNGPQ